MCPLHELWEIIDQTVLHLLCLSPRLSSQSSWVHKQNNQSNTHMHTVSQRVHCFRANVKYPSVGISLLTLIYPSKLTYEVTFLTIGKWSIIPHSSWSMPSRRAFFQKPPTWIHQYTIEMPRFVLPNTLCIFSLLYLADILPKQLGFATELPSVCLFLLQMSGELKYYD